MCVCEVLLRDVCIKNRIIVSSSCYIWCRESVFLERGWQFCDGINGIIYFHNARVHRVMIETSENLLWTILYSKTILYISLAYII